MSRARSDVRLSLYEDGLRPSIVLMYTSGWRSGRNMRIAGLFLVVIAAVANAQSKLTLTVHTGHGQVGYDVNSTLISGEKDLIVIDPQFSLSEAHKLAAEILESKKNLTTIYITHPHPDHLFGLAVLHQAFPEAKILAL